MLSFVLTCIFVRGNPDACDDLIHVSSIANNSNGSVAGDDVSVEAPNGKSCCNRDSNATGFHCVCCVLNF